MDVPADVYWLTLRDHLVGYRLASQMSLNVSSWSRKLVFELQTKESTSISLYYDRLTMVLKRGIQGVQENTLTI